MSSRARAVVGAERATAARVTWILRAEDCFTCRTPVAELRRVTRAAGAAVSVHAVVVGNRARDVRALMRRYRIDAVVTSLSRGAYRRAFGRLPLPGVYVALGDSLVAVWFGDDAARAEIHDVALAVLGRRATARPSPLPGALPPLTSHLRNGD